ncbi:MAG: conjugal transfer pilus assembly protein TraB, partial [Alteromonadaceae bacterium]
MNKIKQAITQGWQNSRSATRQKLVKFGAGGGVLLLILLSYYGSGEAQRRGTEVVATVKRSLNLGGDLLKDDIQEKVKSDLKQQNDLIGEQNQRVSVLEEVLPAIQKELSRLKNTKNDPAPIEMTAASEHPRGYPSAPNYQPPPGYQPLPQPVVTQPPIKEEIIGGVGHSVGKEQQEKPQVKKQKSFYLAPGFMEAQLLHGIEAYTSEGAMANPEPLLIRVQAPAVLPNDIRAQLTGCFVIANMHGSLAKERVEGQVVNLTCLSP